MCSTRYASRAAVGSPVEAWSVPSTIRACASRAQPSPEGGAGQPAARRFANDLRYRYALPAVSALANRSKGDKGHDRWRPMNREYSCHYAQAWATGKCVGGLRSTAPEREALGDAGGLLSEVALAGDRAPAPGALSAALSGCAVSAIDPVRATKPHSRRRCPESPEAELDASAPRKRGSTRSLRSRRSAGSRMPPMARSSGRSTCPPARPR